jgi:hypothetical protein
MYAWIKNALIDFVYYVYYVYYVYHLYHVYHVYYVIMYIMYMLLIIDFYALGRNALKKILIKVLKY